MLKMNAVHHIAVICSKYETSKNFYTEILGFSVIGEHYREERKSWKLDLALEGRYTLELFSFPNPPTRVSRPEACGLRHLAFSVNDIEKAVKTLNERGVTTEHIRTDAFTGKRFTFFADPDDLPIELYEQ